MDKSKLYKIYDTWPLLSEQSYHNSHKKIKLSNIDHIVFVGMGGSGTIGDIMSSILSQSDIHVSVVKGYLLPKTVDENTLVVFTSISGNTIEVISVLKSAIKTKCKIVSFSGGGKLEKLSYQYNIPHNKIKMIHSPRATFPIILYSMLNVLSNVLPITKDDIEESIVQLKNTSSLISSTNLTSNNPSLNLAHNISKIPILYCPSGLKSAAVRFKNSLQENAKLHAMTEDIIEACHNGIVAWENTHSNVIPILIQGVDDSNTTRQRWNILKKFFRTKSIKYYEISSIEGNIISKLINLIYVLDYATIYLSILSGIDPTPIRPIEFVKSELS